MTPEDIELSDTIFCMREDFKLKLDKMLDDHVQQHYSGRSDFWMRCKRAQIEVDSWPVHKQHSIHAQNIRRKS